MEKEDLVKIFDTLSCFNLKEYLTNFSWSEQVVLATTARKEGEDKKEDVDAALTEEYKQQKNEMKLLKIYNSLIEEPIFGEKFQKLSEKYTVESSSKISKTIHGNLDDYYERKNLFYEKLATSFSQNKSKGNKLFFNHNPELEKCALKQSVTIENFPGLKPRSNWPFSLDDLLKKLSETSIEEIFLQPLSEEKKKTLHEEGLEKIKEFSTSGEEEYYVKGTVCLLSMMILFGDFITLYDTLEKIKEINSSAKTSLTDLLFGRTKEQYKDALKVLTNLTEQLKEKISENNFSPLPIMRNYAIIDYFNISNILLSSLSKSSFAACSSICTDGSYLYIIIGGVDGAKLKVGTGNNGTIRGHVYVNVPILDEGIFQWVCCNGKLYLKRTSFSSSSGNASSLGNLTVLSCEDLRVIGNIRLFLPDGCLKNAILKKNESYNLMTDGKKLFVLIAELMTNNKEEKEEDEEVFLRNELSLSSGDYLFQIQEFAQQSNQNKYQYMNLQLITYNPETTLDRTLDKEKITLINEIYEAFSQIYNKDEIYKALLMNKFNPMKTAVYLANSPKEINQSILVPEETVTLYQNEIENIIAKSNRYEIKIKRSSFEVTRYDSVKWHFCGDFVVGYHLKEGSCALFTRDVAKTDNLYKKSTSIQFSDFDYLTTYDIQNKYYYALLNSNQTTSQTVVVIDTFIQYADEMNKIFNLKYDPKEPKKLSDLTEVIFNYALIASTAKKCDMIWNYSDWNFYYNLLIDKINIDGQTDSFGGFIGLDKSIPSNKTLNHRLKKITNEYREKILSSFPSEIREKFDFTNIENPSLRIKYPKSKPTPELTDWGNWLNKSGAILELKPGLKETEEFFKQYDDKTFFEGCKRNFFFSIDGKYDSLDYLYSALTKCEDSENKVFLLKLFYLWFINADLVDFVSNQTKYELLWKRILKALEELFDSSSNEDVKKCVCRIILEGWELLCKSLLDQINWFKKIYAFDKSKHRLTDHNIELNIARSHFFEVLLQKIDLTYTSNNIINNFNNINSIKSFTFHPIQHNGVMKIVMKVATHSLTLKNIQDDFHCGLWRFSLPLVKFPSSPRSSILKINEDESYDKSKEEKFDKQVKKSYYISKGLHIGKEQRLLDQKIKTIPEKKEIVPKNYNVYKDTLWGFFLDNFKDERLIELLSDLFCLCIGDLTELFNNKHLSKFTSGNFSSEAESFNSTEEIIKIYSNIDSDYYINYINFFKEGNYFINKIFESVKVSQEFYKSSIKPYIALSSNFLYSLFNKIKGIPISTLSTINDILKSSKELFKGLLNEIDFKDFKGSQGIQYYTMHGFQHTLISNEYTSINNQASFNSDCVAVEVDFKKSKNGNNSLNNEILIISDHHPPNYYRNPIQNFLRNFGTCVKVKLDQNFKNIFYLKGRGVQIISPSEKEENKTFSKKNVVRGSGYGRKDHSKSSLKILVYQYNGDIGYFKKNPNVTYDISTVSLLCLLIEDIEYYTSMIYKNLIKSFDLDSLDDLTKKCLIIRFGLRDNSISKEFYSNYSTKINFNPNNYHICNFSSSSKEKTTNEENENNNENLYELKTLMKIREKYSQPITYQQLMKLPSFSKEDKKKWNDVEVKLVCAILYHLNLIEDFKFAFETEKLISIEPYFEFIAKKINSILTQMANSAKDKKDNYDFIKGFLIDYEDEYSKVYTEIKKAIIENYFTPEDKKEETKETIKEPKDTAKEKPSKPKKSLKDKFLSKDDPSYKKKRNARRLYTPLPKTKKEKKHDEKPQSNNEEKEVSEKTVIDYENKTVGELLNILSIPIDNLPTDLSNKIKSLNSFEKNLLQKLEKEIKETFFSQQERLKRICEANGIEFDSSDPNVSIKHYTSLIEKKINSIISSGGVSTNFLEPFPSDNINSSLNLISPFSLVANDILDKINFVLTLNHYDDSSNEISTLGVISRENSRTTSYHSSFRTKSKRGEEEENFLLDSAQKLVLRSLLNFLSKPHNTKDITKMLQKQYVRGTVRQLGINMLADAISTSSGDISNSLIGIISSAVSDLTNGVETNPPIIDDNIQKILKNNINLCIDLISKLINPSVDKGINKVLISLTKKKSKSSKISSNNNLAIQNIYLVLSDIYIFIRYFLSKRNSALDIDNNLVHSFIQEIVDFLFIKTTCESIHKYCNEVIILIIKRLLGIKSHPYTEFIYTAIVNLLDNSKNASKVTYILSVLKNIMTSSIDKKNTNKIATKLTEMIETSENYEIVSLSTNILSLMTKNVNASSIDLNRLFVKMGKLFTFNLDNFNEETLIKKCTSEKDKNKYHVIVQMNANEIDYQFLLTALYHFEELRPTGLSKYKSRNIETNHSSLKINEDYNHKVKVFSNLRSSKGDKIDGKEDKMDVIDKIIDEKISNVKKSLEAAQKAEKDEKLQTKLSLLRAEEKYLQRISHHSKLAREIGENASTRGFAILSTEFTYSEAKLLAELIHKAKKKLLTPIPCSPNEPNKQMFNDNIIYPKMPTKNQLRPGCTNTLKETTVQCINVTIIEKGKMAMMDKCYEGIKEKILRNWKMEDKKQKSGAYNNSFLSDCSKSTISSINYNEGQRLISAEIKSGKSVSMIIELIIKLIYTVYSASNNISGLIKKVRIKLQKFSSDIKNDKQGLIGMMLFICDYYDILRINSTANVNSEKCIIINGGDKCGKNKCNVMFQKSEKARSEKVVVSKLKKVYLNKELIKSIALKEIVDVIISSYEAYENEETFTNRIILQLSLKMLNMKEIEKNELNNIITNKKDTYEKLTSILTKISKNTIWLEEDEKFWETEFIESFERIYDKIEPSYQSIITPIFPRNEYSENPQTMNNKNLITGYELPISNYIKQLPKLKDLSKCNTALRNIIIFDRYFVGEIFAYCQKQYRDDEYVNSLSQIRYHLSNGDIANARTDIDTIFDNNRTPMHVPQMKDNFDPASIMKEDIFCNKYYLCKLTNRFVSQCNLAQIKKLYNMRITDIPVVVLLQDNAIGQSLVLYIDDNGVRCNTLWVNSENLMYMEKSIKPPSVSFEADELTNEYKYLDKKLSILYAKRALGNILNYIVVIGKLSSSDEIIRFCTLNCWMKYKLNCVSGVFHDFAQYVTIKKTNENNEKDLKKENDKITDNADKVLPKANNSSKNLPSIKSSFGKSSSVNPRKVIQLLPISNPSMFDSLIQWCITQWSQIDSQIISISTNLFKPNNDFIALHKLIPNNAHNTSCGMILSFSQKANLGPHAKMSFYSDPYCENLISETSSFKTVTNNLESCVFNYSKVWMKYTPGTRAFYIYEWDIQTRDSVLPCIISTIPYIWSPLIEITDNITNALFNNLKKENVNVFSKIIKVLLDKCVTMSIPAVLQAKIFMLINRTVLKLSKYISLCNCKDDLTKMSIKEKLNYIGIEQDNLIKFIKKIDQFGKKDNVFSSSYIVEGVELILAVYSVIGESFADIGNVPQWAESMLKLGECLNYLQGGGSINLKSLEEEHLNSKNIFDNIAIIKTTDKVKKENIIDLIKKNTGRVVDVDKDVLEYSIENNKFIGFVLDGFIVDSEVKKEVKEEEDPLWTCFYCKNENDKENTLCIYCDKNKKVLPKEKKKQEPTEAVINVAEQMKDKMNALLSDIRNLDNSLVIYQGEDALKNSKDSTLNIFLSKRLKEYANDKDFINERVNQLSKIKTIPKEIINGIQSAVNSKDYEDAIALYKKLAEHNIDLYFEHISYLDISKEPINIPLMEQIREEIDSGVSKETKLSLILPSSSLRIIPLAFNSINHSHLLKLSNISLSTLRYYWSIIKHFNTCLAKCLPYIKPPDYYVSSLETQNDDDCINIVFPKAISAFLSTARGIMFSHIKKGLIKEVLSATEFTEEEIQIPTFKFERLLIAANAEKKNNDAKEEDEENNITEKVTECNIEDSMFLQAYEQYKDIDVAFFRPKKFPGDPHVSFKVEFKGELVQGIGGPYRQFFSDISSELNNILPLLIKTPNNVAQKGEYKDRYTVSPSYNSNTSLNHFEFLGILMGICIRTGVHMTIDLASYVWKKIIDEIVTLDDIYKLDEGLFNLISALNDETLTVEKFNNDFNMSYEVELSDGTIKELIPEGNNVKVTYTDRMKFLSLVVNARMNESEKQIKAIRSGLSKIIPLSLMKLITHKELELMVCGAKKVDISLLKANTKLSPDLTENSHKVRWLWEILSEISEEDKVKFIKFCWAQERLPATNEEFIKNQICFTIKSHTDKTKKNIFPRADTCFFNLELPEYTSKNIMKKKIIQAINLDNVGMNADKVVQTGGNRNYISYNNGDDMNEEEEF